MSKCPKSTSDLFTVMMGEQRQFKAKATFSLDTFKRIESMEPSTPLQVPERFSTYIITITSLKMLPSYLEAERSLHASFIIKEFGQGVTCINASTSLVRLMSNGHIISPSWTPRAASV